MSMAISSTAAVVFLIFAAPISIWAIWSDLSRMKIPNKSVVALTVCFAVAGFFVLELNEYLWRWSHLAVILVIGFIMNMLGMLGAGDAKFAAAMAPLVALGDAFQLLTILAIMIVLGFTLHRIARNSKAITSKTPDWVSWDRRDYPMGLSLGLTLITYLVLGALFGA